MSRRTSSDRPVADSRKGMTLIELMVAMLILGVGLLGMAGVSLTVSRQFGTAARQADAAMIVQSRIDSLSSVACSALAPTSSPVTGVTVTRGVRERWSITDGNDIKTIVDSVSFKGRARPLVYTSIIPCRD
jgi:prepilin-type N-terminal cleavage/methylation domain-containing protein